MAAAGEASLRPQWYKDLHSLVLLSEGGAACLMGALPPFTELQGSALRWVPFPFPVTSPTLAAGAPESAFLGWKQGGGCGEKLMCD